MWVYVLEIAIIRGAKASVIQGMTNSVAPIEI